MMPSYLFILGRDYKLSLLEIVAYLKARKIKHRLREYSEKVAVFSLDNLDMKKLIKNLGGCLKIAKVIDPDSIIFTKNKVRYAISDYGSNFNSLKKLKDVFKREKVKGILKKAARKKQMMPSESIKFMKKGTEFVLFKDYLARVVAVFDPKEHEGRDRKPKYDFKKVISIRLAKILINLSQINKGLLLDPFCGYGTVLQEALLMNSNVIGVDIDRDVIRDAETNLRWLKRKYGFKGHYKLIRGDSTKLRFLVKNIDSVATEPYLGPFWKQLPSKERAKEVMDGLEELYFEFLKELRIVLKKEGKVAIIVPKIRTKNGVVGMNFKRILAKTGFKVDNFFNKISFPVLYANTNDRIEREIYVLRQ